MRGKRCQVCDGAVVNGRCRLCGMPYRNDEILYHLNENRSDHYRHATERAKKIMREQQIPSADRKLSGQKRASKPNTRVPQQRTGRVSAGGSQQRTGRVSTGGSQQRTERVSTRGSQQPQKKKTKSKMSGVSVIITIVIILIGIFPSVISHIREEYRSSLSYPLISEIDGLGITEWKDSDQIRYSLEEGYEVEVGFDLPPGTYEFYMSEGTATVQVKGQDGSTEYEIEDGDDFRFIDLEEGDLVSVRDMDSADGKVRFELLSEA